MTIEELVTMIQAGLPGAEVFARDLTGGGDHFEAFVVSDLFVGKNSLVRHKMVMAPLAEPLKGPLHALTIKTFTQDEWSKT